MAAIVAVTAAVIFVLGFTLGAIFLVSMAIRREERHFLRTGEVSITHRTHDPAMLAGRGVTGLWVRTWDDEEFPPAVDRTVTQHRNGPAPKPGPQDSPT